MPRWLSFTGTYCPSGWFEVFGYGCYSIARGPMNWKNAIAYCESQGAYLATIETTQENDYLERTLKTIEGSWCIRGGGGGGGGGSIQHNLRSNCHHLTGEGNFALNNCHMILTLKPKAKICPGLKFIQISEAMLIIYEYILYIYTL